MRRTCRRQNRNTSTAKHSTVTTCRSTICRPFRPRRDEQGNTSRATASTSTEARRQARPCRANTEPTCADNGGRHERDVAAQTPRRATLHAARLDTGAEIGTAKGTAERHGTGEKDRALFPGLPHGIRRDLKTNRRANNGVPARTDNRRTARRSEPTTRWTCARRKGTRRAVRKRDDGKRRRACREAARTLASDATRRTRTPRESRTRTPLGVFICRAFDGHLPNAGKVLPAKY